MKYPIAGDYDVFIRNPEKFLLDDILRHGDPVKQSANPNLLRVYSGGNAIVYEFQTKEKKYALKCWTADLGDLKIRYKAIDEYLSTACLSYFVDFSYNDEGIIVHGNRFPTVRMEWIDGLNLNKFIDRNIDNTNIIRQLSENFLGMVKSLHSKNISHGDLQHGNIIIRKDGKICLIDYDSLCVPNLINEPDNVKGLPGYQHPSRKHLSKLNPKSDYFSELVIYITLLVLVERPDYWERIKQEEHLLFSEKDLLEPRSSQIFSELTHLSHSISYLTQELEKYCQCTDLEVLKPLEDLIESYGGLKLVWSSVFIPREKEVSVFPRQAISSESIVSQPLNRNSPDPWEKLNSAESNVWDKLKNPSASDEAPWEKLENLPVNKPTKQSPIKVSHSQTVQRKKEEDIWDKIGNIFAQAMQSVSSIWDKFVDWLGL